MRSGKLVIAEGGGPTAVINQSLVGAVLEARLFRQIDRVYGARYGVRGIVNEDFVDLSEETRTNLEAVAATPSSALGSTRDKPDLAYCRNILASLRAHGAAWFLYIGGNDTAETVRLVSEEAAKVGYDLRCVHVPKTIDNDLMESDHAPGFPRSGFYGRRPRQSLAAGCLRRGRDGPRRRIPDRCIGRSTDSRERRTASDLPA
jgi:6-phosphofructokinase